ncbi:C-type lectin domain family 4 member M-like isoform X1 [Oncorhynchus kisutch]|uniref:C-type lectin domain family 4 member M-like isoform X1 n=2 Tax=Oncorhynchus kisutch TaxID=8019 RepID=UPI0012DEDC07|nr:C-type lectin domain family 4 member M-like isoform X1 [Oncorhynchus kisutch]
MEMSEDIVYANEDVRGKQSVSGDHFYNRGDDIYEDIYETPDTIKFNDFRNKTEDVTPRSRPGAKLSESEQPEKRPLRAAAMCLGLLSVLLLSGIIGLYLYYDRVYNNLTEDRDQLQTSYNNLTEDRDQLQTSYNNLTEDRDQLQTSYNNLTEDRDQLQTSYNNLIAERDQLQTSYNNLIEERDQLQTSYNNLTEERDQLPTSYNNLTEERDQLQTSYNNLTEERDQLPTSYNNLTEERDQLQTSYNNLTEERDQLQTSYNNLTEERDQLPRRAERSGCPVGWRKFDCSCYFLSIVSKTWEESRQDCLNRGGDLVIIQSREEQDHIKTFKVMSWIGLTDEAREGLWTWVDNTQLTTAEYWHPDEPNGGREENCGMIQMNYDAWNDTSCSAALPWICEKYAYC